MNELCRTEIAGPSAAITVLADSRVARRGAAATARNRTPRPGAANWPLLLTLVALFLLIAAIVIGAVMLDSMRSCNADPQHTTHCQESK